MMMPVDHIPYIMHKAGDLGKLDQILSITEGVQNIFRTFCYQFCMGDRVVRITQSIQYFIAPVIILKYFLVVNSICVCQWIKSFLLNGTPFLAGLSGITFCKCQH